MRGIRVSRVPRGGQALYASSQLPNPAREFTEVTSDNRRRQSSFSNRPPPRILLVLCAFRISRGRPGRRGLEFVGRTNQLPAQAVFRILIQPRRGGRGACDRYSTPNDLRLQRTYAARLMCPCFRCQGDKEEVRAGTYRRRGIPLALFLNLAPHSCQALLKRQPSPELPHPYSPSSAWRRRMPRSHRYSQERLIRNIDDRRTIRKTS